MDGLSPHKAHFEFRSLSLIRRNDVSVASKTRYLPDRVSPELVITLMASNACKTPITPGTKNRKYSS